MSVIPGLTCIVERNGTPIDVKSVSITREANKISPSWDVQFPRPLNVSADDTWTIRTGFAGAEWTRLENCPATNVGGDDGTDTSSRKISSSAQSADALDLRQYCIPKTLVFVNANWLQAIGPTATVKNGAVYYNGVRLYHPRLPGQEFQESSFECIVGPTNHHDIGRYLASLIGYKLLVNTPNVNLIDTMTFSGGTKWGDAITSIFSVWGPTLDVLPSGDDGKPTIVISDVANGSAEIAELQILRIDNPAIVSTSFTDDAGNQSQDIVDHVIVTGRKTSGTLESPEQANYTPIEIPPVDLSIDKEFEASIDVDNSVTRYSKTGGAVVPFGTPGEELNIKKIKTQKHIMRYHVRKVPNQNDQYMPVEDETQFYNVDDELVGKTVVKHQYSAAFKPIATIEEEWLLTNWPKQEQKELRLLRTKTTLQNQFIKPLNQSQTTEMIEEVILFNWTEYEGEQYRTDPVSMADVLRQDYSRSLIDTDSDTSQDTVTLLTHTKMTDISRTFDDILIKRDTDHALIPDKFRMNSQILENPQRDKPKTVEVKYRKEFFNGPGQLIGGYGPCYHTPRTVDHDDIDNDTLAEQIAERVFARKSSGNCTVTIKTPVPIPLETTAIKVRLAAFSRVVNGAEMTIPEADYVLKSVHETFSFDGEENQVSLKYEQTLTVRTKF
ncbi:MAG: hypothetical protein HY913_04445 [Desulfomonile tiedjei]|nr:hypothetical protein [Desulfomonile tiedjei]